MKARGIVSVVAGMVTALLVAGSAVAQTRLVMAGSSSGGTAHLYFASLAPMLNKYVPGMEASARTGGAVENVALLERGGVQVAVAGPGDAQSVLGKEGLEKSRIRTLFAMFHIPFHIVVPEDSPIKSFADLKGKRVSVGIRAGGEANLFLRLLERLRHEGKRREDRVPRQGRGNQRVQGRQRRRDDVPVPAALPGRHRARDAPARRADRAVLRR